MISTDDGSHEDDDDYTSGQPRGLVNLGNTCFLNSAVQSLAACRPLLSHLQASQPLLELPATNKPKGVKLTNAFSSLMFDLRPDERQRQPKQPMELVQVARGLTPALEGSGQQDVEEFLNALLDGVHEHLKRPLSDREETDLKARLAQRWRRCTGQEWRDEAKLAYEAQLKAAAEKSGAKSKPAVQGTGPKKAQSSMMSDLFQGELLSAVTCCGCGQVSYTCDPFFSLSVPIPSRHFDMSEFEIQSAMDVEMENDSKGSNGNGGGNGNGNPRKAQRQHSGGLFSGLMRTVVPSVLRPGTSGGTPRGPGQDGAGGGGGGGLHSSRGGLLHGAKNGEFSVYDAMGEFFSVEDLGGENCYRCEKCKNLQKARKHLRTLSLPPILTLHLKRFRYGLGAKKASDKIAFPLVGLDLDAFAAPTRDDSRASNSHSHTTMKGGDEQSSSPPSPEAIHGGPGGGGPSASGSEYDLVALIAHHGSSLTSGHYTAYVRVGPAGTDRAQWYHCDDSKVTPVSAETVLSSEAYVLFYERRQSESHVMHRRRIIKAIKEHQKQNGGAINQQGGSRMNGGMPPGLNSSQYPLAATAMHSKNGGNHGDAVLLSRGWFARYIATDSPGPVTHADALCPHDSVDAHANTGRSIQQTIGCFVHVPRPVWSELTTRFCQHAECAMPLIRLSECRECSIRHQQEKEALDAERLEISQLDSTKLEQGQTWFLVEAGWLKHWREYCWDATRQDPPGPVRNWILLAGQQPRPNLVRARDYRGVNQEVWSVFIRRYGGQPAICRYELDIYAPPAPIPASLQER